MSLSIDWSVLEASGSEATAVRHPAPGDSFPVQWSYVTCEDRRIALLCSRQAGKTQGTRLRARRALAAGRKVLYVAMIRENAVEQFFAPLVQEVRDSGWPLGQHDVNWTYLYLRPPGDGLVHAWSADSRRAVPKGRGYQWDEVVIDEAQSFPDDVLLPLLDHVIIPTLIKRRGTLVVQGTPPDALRGYFVEAWESGKWTRFGWSIFDNPHIPRENVQEAYAARGIGPGHPIWEREVEGRLVADPEAVVYPYDRARNGMTADSVPEELDRSVSVWRTAMGLDLGFRDKSAIAVVAWRREDADRRLYVVHEWEQAELNVDQLAAAVGAAVHRWRPSVVTADHGGHAAQAILKTLSDRLGVDLSLKPGDLVTSTQLLADDFRAGRLRALPTSLVARDAALVTWAEVGGRLLPNARGYHSDVLDALRYAHWGARHWAAKAPKPAPTLDQQRRAWEERKRKAMLRSW